MIKRPRASIRVRAHQPASIAPRGDQPPRVTVVIPCYNYGRYLPACVRSVLSQDGVDVDALIVDDASTDGSTDVARVLAGSDQRVTVIEHATNMGHISTYNDGLQQATGKYVVLLSADDMLTPGSLARATLVMEREPSVGLVYGNPLAVQGDVVPPARTRVRSVRIWRGSDWIRAQCRRGLNCINCPEAIVRTSVQRRVGGYTAALPHTADLEMWLRVAAIADVARVNGSDQAYRRLHDASMIHVSYPDFLTDLRERNAAYESFFERHSQRIQVRRDLEIARRRLAEEALDHACAALRGGDPSGPDADDYAAFAQALVGEDVRRLWRWREHQLLRHRSEPPQAHHRVRLRCNTLRRDVEEKYRSRRWRWTGV
jgi:Glycosyl transferase family 2